MAYAQRIQEMSGNPLAEKSWFRLDHQLYSQLSAVQTKAATVDRLLVLF